jgi:hypothetical protein
VNFIKLPYEDNQIAPKELHDKEVSTL